VHFFGEPGHSLLLIIWWLIWVCERRFHELVVILLRFLLVLLMAWRILDCSKGPLAACGSWLAPIDQFLSGFASLPLSAGLGIGIMSSLGLIDNHVFKIVGMFSMYFNEMNHFDHCGKQVPLWSGFPLLPPLGFALRLHEGIPIHHSHHNFKNCGFGLLGIADWTFGTIQYPPGHEKYKKKSQKYHDKFMKSSLTDPNEPPDNEQERMARLAKKVHSS